MKRTGPELYGQLPSPLQVKHGKHHLHQGAEGRHNHPTPSTLSELCSYSYASFNSYLHCKPVQLDSLIT